MGRIRDGYHGRQPHGRPLRIRGVYEPSHLSVVDDVADIEFERPAMPTSGPRRTPPADPASWPEIFAIPSGPVAAAAALVAGRLLRRAARRLPIRLVYPDGTMIGDGDHTAPVLSITQPDRLARRLGRHGLIGFGES